MTCRTPCDRTPVPKVFEAKLCPVRCIKMRISGLLPILNVNSLSQSYNGLIVRLSLEMIDFHSNLTCLLLPYLLSHFNAPFQHGDIMVFCQNRKLHRRKIKHSNLVTTFATITRSYRLCCLHFGRPLRAYAMSNYLWDPPDLYMLIL